jgi:hypothetical protein
MDNGGEDYPLNSILSTVANFNLDSLEAGDLDLTSGQKIILDSYQYVITQKLMKKVITFNPILDWLIGIRSTEELGYLLVLSVFGTSATICALLYIFNKPLDCRLIENERLMSKLK